MENITAIVERNGIGWVREACKRVLSVMVRGSAYHYLLENGEDYGECGQQIAQEFCNGCNYDYTFILVYESHEGYYAVGELR